MVIGGMMRITEEWGEEDEKEEEEEEGGSEEMGEEEQKQRGTRRRRRRRRRGKVFYSIRLLQSQKRNWTVTPSNCHKQSSSSDGWRMSC